jgi:hypothetical protein
MPLGLAVAALAVQPRLQLQKMLTTLGTFLPLILSLLLLHHKHQLQHQHQQVKQQFNNQLQ